MGGWVSKKGKLLSFMQRLLQIPNVVCPWGNVCGDKFVTILQDHLLWRDIKLYFLYLWQFFLPIKKEETRSPLVEGRQMRQFWDRHTCMRRCTGSRRKFRGPADHKILFSFTVCESQKQTSDMSIEQWTLSNINHISWFFFTLFDLLQRWANNSVFE